MNALVKEVLMLVAFALLEMVVLYLMPNDIGKAIAVSLLAVFVCVTFLKLR